MIGLIFEYNGAGRVETTVLVLIVQKACSRQESCAAWISYCACRCCKLPPPLAPAFEVALALCRCLLAFFAEKV